MISIRPILAPWLFACLLIGGIVSCRSDDHKTLVVGMELAAPPFEMTDTKGRPMGVSVDLAKALAAQLGKRLVIENIPFDGLIVALKTGKIDLIISSMTATPERAKSIDFSQPYLQTGLCLLVGADTKINSMADVDQPGRLVTVKKGTTGHLYADEHLQHAKMLVLDKESSCVLEVAQGKADAFIYGQMNVLEFWQHHPNTTRALLHPIQTESWAIGVRKNEPERLDQVNHFIEEYRADGGFELLGDRWLKSQRKAFEDRGVPFLF